MNNFRIDPKAYQITISVLALVLAGILIFYLTGSPAPSGQENPDVAYLDMGTANKGVFLAAWTDKRQNNDIVGAIIGPRENNVLNNFVIAVNSADLLNPAVAANKIDQEFLVVWVDARNGALWDIYGQRVSYDSKKDETNLEGPNFAISKAYLIQKNVAVAFNPKKKQYLVVWQDERNLSSSQEDIYAQLVDYDGKLSGGNFVVCNNSADNFRPAVAYNDNDDEYLVVWQDYRKSPGPEIYGQRVSSTGTLKGGEIEVSSSNKAYNPDVTYNSHNNKFCVVWDDWRDYKTTKRDVYGQLLAYSDTSWLDGVNFVISDAKGSQGEPSVASYSQGFLVSFDDTRNKPATNQEIYAQRLNLTGGQVGTNFVVCDQKDYCGYSSIAYASADASFLIVWQDDRNLATASTDIYGHHVDDKGALISPPASDENFVISVPGVKK